MELKQEKVFFKNLDALRTIAFLLVFSEHVFWKSFRNVEFNSDFLKHILYDLFANGRMGVSVFFVLSGFLITYFLLQEIKNTGKLNVKRFYLKRTLRIWPLYMALLLFVFLIYPIIQKLINVDVFNNPANPIMYFTFLANFDMINIHQQGLESFMQTGVTWSIAIEEQFYFIWPILFLLCPKKYLVLLFLSIVFTSVVFRYMHSGESVYIYFHTLGVCGDLAIGGLAAWFSFTHYEKLQLYLPSNLISRIVIYAIGIFFILTNNYFVTMFHWPAFSRLISTLFFAYIILDQNFANSKNLQFSSLKLFSYLGKYTYGLYMLHPIAYTFNRLWIDYFDIVTEGFVRNSIFSLITLLVTFVLALLSYNLLEKPFLRLKNQLT